MMIAPAGETPSRAWRRCNNSANLDRLVTLTLKRAPSQHYHIEILEFGIGSV